MEPADSERMKEMIRAAIQFDYEGPHFTGTRKVLIIERDETGRAKTLGIYEATDKAQAIKIAKREKASLA